jgi:hypothetical protein
MTVKQIPIDDVLPGMALGDNVQGDGHILLRAGTLLTVSSLDALRRRGIESLPIQVKAVIDPAHLAAERARLEQVLQLRFRRTGRSAAAQSLQQAALEVLLEAQT